MSSNETNSDLRNLASQLHKTFVANHWAHAEQLADGKYSTVYRPLGITRIESLLVNEESCLTYQLSSGGLRWVCFDVDIKRETLIIFLINELSASTIYLNVQNRPKKSGNLFLLGLMTLFFRLGSQKF